MSLEVDTRAIARIKSQLDEMTKRMNTPQPVMKRIGSYFALRNRKRFATNGTYDGKPSMPLKPDYMQWKIQHGYGIRTLVRTSKMKNSYTSRPMSIEKYGKFVASYGTKVKYAQFHEDGTRRMPSRTVMTVTSKVEKDVKTIIQNYVYGTNFDVRKLLQ